MKTTLAIFLLSCTALLAAPATPALRSISTTTNGFELRWECSLADVEAFQVIRTEKASTLPPLPDAAKPLGQPMRWFTLSLEKVAVASPTTTPCFVWKDTNAVAGVTYSYSVISLSVDGPSKPSNQLTVTR